jgi:hypothetical protein
MRTLKVRDSGGEACNPNSQRVADKSRNLPSATGLAGIKPGYLNEQIHAPTARYTGWKAEDLHGLLAPLDPIGHGDA